MKLFSTKRLAQLTGDYDPEGLPHLNNTGAWGVEGTDLGANTDHDGRLYIFFGDVPQDPAKRSWPPPDADLIAFADPPPADAKDLKLTPVLKDGAFYPFTVTGQYSAPPGAALAAAHQDDGQLNVFYVGRDGGLHVTWVTGRGVWRSPARITPPHLAPPGGGVAAAKQHDAQLDVFFVGYDGAVHVVWVHPDADPDKPDAWQGPLPITPPGVAPAGANLAAVRARHDQLEVFFIGHEGAVLVTWVVDVGTWQPLRPVTAAEVAPPGGGVAAARYFQDRIDVFFVAYDGAAYHVSSPIDHAQSAPPGRALTPPKMSPPGSSIALAMQVLPHQLDVFIVDEEGGIHVMWRADPADWKGPVPILPGKPANPGSGLAAARQGDNQLDVFFVGRDGGVHVAWVVDAGDWQGPAPVAAPEMIASDQQHAFYRARDGHIHHVFWDARSGSRHHDVWTIKVGAPPAAGKLATMVFGDQQHIFYRDEPAPGEPGHIHHIFWDAETNRLYHDVWTDEPDAIGDPATMVFRNQQHVFYRAKDGHIHHVFFDGTTQTLWRDRWTALAPGAKLAAGDPATMVFRDQQHIFYRDDENHISHIFWFGPKSTDIAHDRWTEMRGAPLAVGDPATMAFRSQQHIFYRRADGQIHHIFWYGPTPTHMADDLWTSPGMPLAKGDPAAMVFRNQQHIFYRDEHDHISHIYWWGPTPDDKAHDVWTVKTGAPLAKGDPATMVFRNQQHIFYWAADDGIHHIFWWGPTPDDIAAQPWEAGEGRVADGDPATMVTLIATDLAAAPQMGNQLDAFFVGRDAELYVSWVLDKGDWQGPVRVFDWMPLSNATPCGAYSYDGKVHVFVGHEGSVGLASTAHPELPNPMEWQFEISNLNDINGGRAKFLQVAPCVVTVGAVGPLPASADGETHGLIMFGHGFDWGDNGQLESGIHLAWMPLAPGRHPTASDMWYFRGGSDPWSKQQKDARRLFPTRFTWSSVSVGRVYETNDWILLYQKTGQPKENAAQQTWDEGIFARIVRSPFGIASATEIEIFSPVKQSARGRYMSTQPDPPANPAWPPVGHPSFAYGAYLLNRYTRWDAERRMVTFNYLMSTGCPYQVQVMETTIIFDDS